MTRGPEVELDTSELLVSGGSTPLDEEDRRQLREGLVLTTMCCTQLLRLWTSIWADLSVDSVAESSLVFRNCGEKLERFESRG